MYMELTTSHNNLVLWDTGRWLSYRTYIQKYRYDNEWYFVGNELPAVAFSKHHQHDKKKSESGYKHYE